MWQPQPPAIIRGTLDQRDERPRSSYRHVDPNDEFESYVEINEHGFHDQQHAWRPAPGVFRVVVVGDSYAEALQVSIENTWWSEIGRQLEARLGRPVEMINLGQSSTGTAEQLEIFDIYGAPAHPDLVLLAFCVANDPFNNSFQLEDKSAGRVPFYRLGSNEELVPISDAQLEARRAAVWWPLWRASDTARLVGRYFERRRAGFRMTQEHGYPVLFQVFLADPPAVWNEAMRISVRLIQELQDRSERLGADFAVALVPDAVQVYPHDWDHRVKRFPKMETQVWDTEAPTRHLREALREASIPTIDPLEHFKAHAEDEDRLFFREDIHFTAHGNELFGAYVGGQLVDLGVVEAP
ncbi:MAG: SGNH/GDSL hydrolase family protein [Pseudomonadota bacterium]